MHMLWWLKKQVAIRRVGGLSKALLVGVAALFCDLPAANAYPIIFATGPLTPSGASPAGPVNASASFTMDSEAQTITIALLNLQNNIVSGSQAVSGIEFTVSNPVAAGETSLGLSEAGGTYVNVNKTMGNGTQVVSGLSNQWQAAALSASVLTLCTVCNAVLDPTGTAQPLIGGPDQSKLNHDNYSAADGTIVGNTFLLASGASYTQGPFSGLNAAPVWVVQLPGNPIGATTTITSVTFYFGSVYNTYSIVDTDGITPEPATAVTLVAGLALAVWFGRRRIRTRIPRLNR